MRRNRQVNLRAAKEFSFKLHCSLPHSLLVRKHTDAMKLKNAHFLLHKLILFFLKDTLSQKNEKSTNLFLLIENIFVEFRSFWLLK